MTCEAPPMEPASNDTAVEFCFTGNSSLANALASSSVSMSQTCLALLAWAIEMWSRSAPDTFTLGRSRF